MATITTTTEQFLGANRDHLRWLEECNRWRTDHRRALAMLAKVQAEILEQEAAMETHAADIYAHQLHLHEYARAEYPDGTREKEELENDHAEFAQKHQRASEVHARIRSHHRSIVDEVAKLLHLCESAM